MKNILVAVDGSQNAHRAVMEAKKIGTLFNSKITILNVIEDHTNPSLFSVDHVSGYGLLVQKELEKHSVKLLDTYMKNFKDYSGEVETLTKVGQPADQIQEVAEETGSNLIVMGSRGLGTFPGLMLGSVSNKVINRSQVSVLIVK